MRHFLWFAICALGACASSASQGPILPPLSPSTPAVELLQHANIEGTLAGAGAPTRNHFLGGFAGGALLGPIGILIAYSSADADPAFVPISPAPRYADTSVAYVAAFRQAYDRQVASDRRAATIGGGIFGMLVSGVAVLAIVSNSK